MENPFKELLNKILPEEKEEVFDPQKVPLEMYEVSGQSKITNHSFDRYLKDKKQDEEINKKIHNKLFLTKEDVFSLPEEDRAQLIITATFSADKQERDLAQGILLKLPKKERIMITTLLENYAKDKIDSLNPEIQLAASKILVVKARSEEELESTSKLILPRVEKLINIFNLSQAEQLFNIPESRLWRIILEMTEYLPTKMTFNNSIYGVHSSKPDIVIETAKFIINTLIFSYKPDEVLNSPGIQPFLISEALKNDNIEVANGIVKKIKLLRLDKKGRTVTQQLFNVSEINNTDIAKKNVLSTEHLYELKEDIKKRSYFDVEGKKIIQKIIQKIYKNLSSSEYKIIELAGETAALLLDEIKIDETIIVDDGTVTDEKVITDEERNKLQEAILFKVNKGLGKSNFGLKTKKELVKPNIEIQKSAARMVRCLPEKERKNYIHELFSDNNPEIRKIATELIESAPEEEKINLFQEATDNGLAKELIESPLYDRSSVTNEQFNREFFGKTGSETILIGGELKDKVVIRRLTPRTFMAWKYLFENYEIWRNKNFDYVPVEPIISYKIDNEEMVRVYSGILDLNVEQWLGKTNKFKSEIEKQMEKIRKVLESKEFIHGHAHNRNFCLRFFRDEKGNPDLNRAPRVYLIDFDKAIF